MNKTFTLVLMFLLFYSCPKLEGQTSFASEYLKNLYEQLPTDCKLVPAEKNSLGKFSIHSNNNIFPINSSVVFHLSANKIKDIGIEVFDSSSRGIALTEDICRFTERKFLELLTTKDEHDFIEKLHSDNVQLSLNNNVIHNSFTLRKAIGLLKTYCEFRVRIDSLFYTLNWKCKDENTFFFSFPITNTLIKAKDKKELDEEIIDDINNIRSEDEIDNEKTLKIVSEGLIKRDSIYYQKGKYFINNTINENLYFKKSNGDYSYLFDPHYFLESISNIIQIPFLCKGLKANIVHRIYGYSEVNYSMKFSDFIKYFKRSCEFYTGFEKKNDDVIKTIVFMVNKNYNVLHIAVINFSKMSLFNGEDPISIRLSTNIPMNNIENLFGNSEPQETRYRVKIK